MTKQDFQHSGGACVGITMELICRITGNRREDAIKKQLWRLLDENFKRHDYDYGESEESVLSGFVGILEAVGCFAPNQIKIIESTLQSEIENQFDDSVGNR